METLRLLQRHVPAYAFDVVRLTNGLILLAILLVPLERLFALRPQKVLRKGLLTDVGYYYLSSLLPNRILALPLAVLALGVQRVGPSILHLWAEDLPAWVRFAAALLVAEIGFYWGHRWMHQNAWLWRFHAIHHSAAEMDWLVNTRAHPVDLVITRLCGYVPLYLLGLAQANGNRIDWVPLLVALVGSMWGYFIHANVRLRFGWLEHVVATPGFHHWHHNNVGPEHRYKNYAPILPWVDRVFGTFYLDRTKWPGAYGIDEPTESGLLGQLLQPFLPSTRGSAQPTISECLSKAPRA
jgi:sterol desaturase/sphingolipid hydroxylase (fatty acid hydroxylase superfamily)